MDPQDFLQHHISQVAIASDLTGGGEKRFGQHPFEQRIGSIRLWSVNQFFVIGAVGGQTGTVIEQLADGDGLFVLRENI